jgi:hypothetical protein
MKLNIKFKILLLNLFVVVLCIAIVVSVPLHLIYFLFKRKNRFFKFLENLLFKTLFEINDLKIQHNHGK